MLGFAVTPRACSASPLLFILAIATVLVAACQQSTRPTMAESVPKPPRQPGYTAEQHYTTNSIHESWTLGGEPAEITLVRPSGRGPFPLVIYLPGLGEPSSGGAAWRNAWAEAGYAVLAYQPVANGATI